MHGQRVNIRIVGESWPYGEKCEDGELGKNWEEDDYIAAAKTKRTISSLQRSSGSLSLVSLPRPAARSCR